MDLVKTQREVVALAERAGVAIRKIYYSDFEVGEKDDSSPVTEADLAADRIIPDGLKGLTPEIPVLTEETFNGEVLIQRRNWEDSWAVDPLDGTREFVDRKGMFSVNIALIHRGRPILGVVHMPHLHITYYACKGNGAWKKVGTREPEKVQTRPADLANLGIVASRSHGNEERLQEFLARFEDPRIIRIGSAYKSCLVASGLADVYIRHGGTNVWDDAAGDCILTEAGGAAFRLDGSTLRYDDPDTVEIPSFMMVGDSNIPWLDNVSS